MKKLFMVFTLLTGIVANVFAQQTKSNGGVTPGNPTTSPVNISQLEVTGRSITQNSFLGTGAIPTIEQTGSFDPAARWNTMGNIDIPGATQVLNGFRTQTKGRGLAWGHSIPNPSQPNAGIVSNSFIEWIGNNGISPAPPLPPGNLEFRYAASSTGASGARVPIFTMAPAFTVGGVPIPSFNYAERDALVGQLQKGSLGSFGISDIWSATGQIAPPFTPTITSYGSRHQYQAYTVNTGLLDNGGNISAIMDFGNDFNASLPTCVFKFRAFTDPNSSSSIKNVWQSSNKVNDMILGIQDYNTVATGNFLLNVFDGVASSASSTALGFVQKAGLYVTGDGVNQNTGNQLSSYAAVVGDVSKVNLAFGSTQKYGILGIGDANGFNAGYFIGNLTYTGTLTPPSDQKFKKDINAEENILPKLMQLQPKNYLFDVEKYKNMAFSNKLQHGLISQEVEKVFPELVVESFAPNTSSDKNEDGKPIPYKGLNYMGLITMLLKGIQEQQVQIDELKSKLETTTSNTLVVTDKNSLPAEIQNKAFALSQNNPNPFSENTTISYSIPATAGKAILAIFDLTGKMLKEYPLTQGKNTIVVKGNTLAAGIYLYSLIADGQEVLSKRMVLTK